jgi:hypothetical protein
MALSLEELLDKGFTRDDIMKLADTGAFASNTPGDEKPCEDEKTEEKKTTETGENVPADATSAALSMMVKMMENQNAMMLKMMENKAAPEPEEKKEETADEKARKYADEQLIKAMQSLNILKDGDTIDIGSAVEKNIENKIIGKLGAMAGFTVDEEKK